MKEATMSNMSPSIDSQLGLGLATDPNQETGPAAATPPAASQEVNHRTATAQDVRPTSPPTMASASAHAAAHTAPRAMAAAPVITPERAEPSDSNTSAGPSKTILRLNQVGYAYNRDQPVFSGLDWQFQDRQLYGIIGRSGAGKTTLLSLLAGLTSPTEGSIDFEGQDLAKIDRYRYRSRDIGVVFQAFNLLPHLTAAENVELSMRASGKTIAHKHDRALALLDRVGLSAELANRRILKLSGGEQQRVAVARALSYDPQVILADEPTGNLDLGTQADIIDMLTDLAGEGKCVIIVTHSPDVAECVDKLYELKAQSVRSRSRHHRARAGKAAGRGNATAGGTDQVGSRANSEVMI
ncbi:MAG: ABC transporter ATP-binding protein [Propionibacteriaceae bacterium]|nr:ABC transporter ATP-binding protein [Propionibacteriaceae bacterium]